MSRAADSPRVNRPGRRAGTQDLISTAVGRVGRQATGPGLWRGERVCARVVMCVCVCVWLEKVVGGEVLIHHMKGDSQNASVTLVETKAREDDDA